MKLSGSYENVVGGVSQQVPEDRREGQHFEQVNFISDPVRGLSRRRGSVFEDELAFAEFNPAYEQATIEDTKSFRSFDFSCAGKKYTLFYRSQAKTTNSQAPFAFCFDRELKTFLPCQFDVDALTVALQSGGCSALVNIGDYVYLAGNTIVPDFTQSFPWENDDNFKLGAVWVTAGFYSKKYKAKLRIKNTTTDVVTVLEAEYETKPSAYPGVLDTSDILFTDPEYQKKVNDRNNDYQTAFNQWIEEAALDILPSNVATKLKENFDIALAASAIPGEVNFTVSNSTLGIECEDGYIIEEIVTTDGADETAIRGVGNLVDDESKFNPEHFPGKVVKVLSKKADEGQAVYFKATPKNLGSVPDALTEVAWIETAGVITTPVDVFVFSTVVGGTVYFSGSAAGLETMTGLINIDNFKPSVVGDDISVKVPYFVGRKISYMGLFQDRLVIGSGSTLTFSRSERNYLNFFRGEMRSILDNDPVEVYSLGSEDDVITHSCFFDKNLLLFGKEKQYFISGQQVFTPKTTAIAAMSSHEDAIDSKPLSSGNLVFYTKFRNSVGSLHQLQPGVVQDSPESYEASSALSNYISGRPIEMMALTTPNAIMVRLDNRRQDIYVYSYLDTVNQERRFDSWSRWVWDEQLGHHIGFTYLLGDISVMTIRKGTDSTNTDRWYVVSDKFVFDTTLTDKPILDSQRPWSSVSTHGATDWLHDESTYENMFAAYDNTSIRFMVGGRFEDILDIIDQYPSEVSKLWVGFESPAYVTPTNPYYRDNKEKAIINGRLTITKYSVAVSDTGGCEIYVKPSRLPERLSADFNGSIIGYTFVPGQQSIADTNVNVVVGKEVRDFTYRIAAKKWLPLTVRSIEWVGQFFYNSRRA